MKYYLLIAFFLVRLTLTAQIYHPFPKKNTLWTERYRNPNDSTVFNCFALKDNDTTINGKLYHKLYRSTDTIFSEDKFCGGIREENKKIYYYAIDSSLYWLSHIKVNTEEVLFDFSLKLGDTLKYGSFVLSQPNRALYVVNVDSILIGGEYRKTVSFGLSPGGTGSIFREATWVEGLGSLRGLLFPIGETQTGIINDLVCFCQNNNLFYHYSKYYACFSNNRDAKDSSQIYYPFPTKNAIWTEMYFNPYPNEYSEFHCYALKDNDTIINGKLYHKLYHSTDTVFTEDKLCGGIRSENKRVYFYAIDSITLFGQQTFPSKKSEIILFDFSLKPGDVLDMKDSFNVGLGNYLVIGEDSVLIGNKYRKTILFGLDDGYPLPWAQWVEGVGSLRGLLFVTGDLPSNGLFNDLICFRQDNNILYHYDTYYNACYYGNPGAVQKISSHDMKLTITPNPVITTAHIEFEKPCYSRLTLSDLYGRVLMEYNIEGKVTLEISRGNLRQGIYFLTIYNDLGSMQTEKVIFE